MSENRVKQVGNTVVGKEIVSKKGAVMKVTKLRLSLKGSEMLRSSSSGIRGKKDQKSFSDVPEDCLA